MGANVGKKIMLNPLNIPVPEMPEAKDFAAVNALLVLVTNPESAKTRLDQLAAASAEARTLIDRTSAAQAELAQERDAQADELRAARDQHDSALAAERDLWHSEVAVRRRELDDREKEVAAREAQVAVQAEANAKLQADLSVRFARLRELSAA